VGVVWAIGVDHGIVSLTKSKLHFIVSPCRPTSGKIRRMPKTEVGAPGDLNYSSAQFDFASTDCAGGVGTGGCGGWKG